MKARLPQGYGKPDVNALMRQAQKMQDDMKEKQDELEATEYRASVSDGMVEITMTGKHEVTAVKIKPELVDPEDVEMLEDMVAAAVNEAVRVVDAASDAAMQAITGGANFPGL